jgi:hypothetical protein
VPRLRFVSDSPATTYDYQGGVLVGVRRFEYFENAGGPGKVDVTVELYEDALPFVKGPLEPLDRPPDASMTESIEVAGHTEYRMMIYFFIFEGRSDAAYPNAVFSPGLNASPPGIGMRVYFEPGGDGLQTALFQDWRGWVQIKSISLELAPTPAPTPTPTPTPIPSPTPTPSPTRTPTVTPAATPLAMFLEIVSVTDPVGRGSQATLEAKTVPGANCTITVYYESGPSQASGLDAKTADAEGRVSWTWRVGANTTLGSYRIVVTAENDGGQATTTIYFTVVG